MDSDTAIHVLRSAEHQHPVAVHLAFEAARSRRLLAAKPVILRMLQERIREVPDLVMDSRARGCVAYLGAVGDSSDRKLLADLSEKYPRFLATIGFSMTEAGTEEARSLLVNVMHRPGEEPENKARASSLLLSRFGDHQGLRMFARGLCSGEVPEFRRSLNAFSQVPRTAQGEKYDEMVWAAIAQQQHPDMLVTVLNSVQFTRQLNSERLALLAGLLLDKRRGREFYGGRPSNRGRVARVQHFAGHYLSLQFQHQGSPVGDPDAFFSWWPPRRQKHLDLVTGEVAALRSQS